MSRPKSPARFGGASTVKSQLNAEEQSADDCNPSNVDWTKRTLGDIQVSARYQNNAKMRDVARHEYKRSGRPHICQNCGYARPIEICHIRTINAFPDDTPVAVVSDLDKLIALCPNCHWEFDHGLLTIAALAVLQS